MSELVCKIREMKGLEVGNSWHFNKFYLDEFMANNDASGKAWHLYSDDNPINADKMVIGGYGDVKGLYGAGHTREFPQAAYTLHFWVTKNSNLYSFSKTSKILSTDIRALQSFIKDFASGAAHVRNEPQLENGHLFFADADKGSMHVDGIITNVNTRNTRYRGDITLHFTKYLGQGSKYLENRYLKIKHPEHERPGSKHVDTNESLRTDVALFSQSIVGSTFRKGMQDEMNYMQRLAKGSGLKYHSQNWLLLVDNLGE